MKETYKEVFTGVEKHKYRKVHVHVDPNFPPVAEPHFQTIYTIREPVAELLNLLEHNDLIEKVNEPTDWVSNMHITAGFDTSNTVEERIRIALNSVNPNIHHIRRESVNSILLKLSFLD